nr:Chain P, POL POLYPROTEIN [synthetic construct]
IRKILFLDGI